MNETTPHYLLYLQTDHDYDRGRWRFEMRQADGQLVLMAQDEEPQVRGERLSLLTLVRALESLDGPSYVTLVGSSPYIRRGFRYGLPSWRSGGWLWERFGQLVPIKNKDLWQRVDRTLRFHQVDFAPAARPATNPLLAMRIA